MNVSTRMKNRTVATTLIAAMLLALAPVAAADDIVLRGSVRLASDAESIRLGDVAELRGDAAAALAATIIAPAPEPGGVVELKVEQVRSSLTDAGAHWGRLNLTGGRVIVRSRRGGATGGLALMAPVSLESPRAGGDDDSQRRAPAVERFEPAPQLASEATVRGVVTRYILDRLGVPTADLRLEISGDPAVLEMRDGERQIEIEQLSAIDSDRIELAVRLWHGALVEGRHSITARVQQRVAAASVTTPTDRHQAIAAGDVSPIDQWLAPRLAATMLDAAGAPGMIAARRLKPGEPITRQDVHGPTVIKRGERAMVRCLVGGLVIAVQAEAMSDGSRGDSIEFRKIGERQPFLATVTGPGEASVDLRVTIRPSEPGEDERATADRGRLFRTSRR
jgi:flagella basal body P-ring formation protein FlgA